MNRQVSRILARSCLSVAEIASAGGYLRYCRDNRVRTSSSTFRGTLYEFLVKEALERDFCFRDMTRKGGAGDGGVDILGKWDPRGLSGVDSTPATVLNNEAMGPGEKNTKPPHLPIAIVQCKNSSKRIGSPVVRNLAGTYEVYAKTKKERDSTFFVLASPFPLTPLGLRQANMSLVPLVHFMVSPWELISSEVDEYDISNYRGGNFEGVAINERARKLLGVFGGEKQLQAMNSQLRLAQHDE